MVVHRPARRRQARSFAVGDASEAIGTLERGCEVFGLTKGQFSAIDLLQAIIAQTGPADVALATWSAAEADIRQARWLVDAGEILSIRLLVDRSFPNRQPRYCAELLRSFDAGVIRVTRLHAKFMLIRAGEWRVVVRTSMNLNKNPRIENFEISDCPALYEHIEGFLDEVWRRHDVAEILTRDTPAIDRAYRELLTDAGEMVFDF